MWRHAELMPEHRPEPRTRQFVIGFSKIFLFEGRRIISTVGLLYVSALSPWDSYWVSGMTYGHRKPQTGEVSYREFLSKSPELRELPRPPWTRPRHNGKWSLMNRRSSNFNGRRSNGRLHKLYNMFVTETAVVTISVCRFIVIFVVLLIEKNARRVFFARCRI